MYHAESSILHKTVKKKKKNSADEQLSEIIFLSCYNKQWLHP